jgi:hypothetical protein
MARDEARSFCTLLPPGAERVDVRTINGGAVEPFGVLTIERRCLGALVFAEFVLVALEPAWLEAGVTFWAEPEAVEVSDRGRIRLFNERQK